MTNNKDNKRGIFFYYFRILKDFVITKLNAAQNKYLIQIEAVNLNSSVFDTNQISIRRGGTIVIHETLSAIREKLVEDNDALLTISIGGSYLLLYFSGTQQNLENLNKEINRILSSQDRNRVSFLVAHSQLESAEISNSEDAAADISASVLEKHRNILTNAIRVQQGRLISLHSKDLSVNFSESENKIAQYCDFDGLRPANASFEMKDHHKNNDDEVENDKVKNVSQYSKSRHHYGSQQKRNYILAALKQQSNDTETNTETETPNYDDIAFTNDLDELSQYPNLEEKPKEHLHINKKIALLYFDGNHMSKAQSSLSANELSAFDNALRKRKQTFLANLVEEFRGDVSLFETVKKGKKADEKEKKKLKLELLLWGGDEIMLAVPSWAGFRVLNLFYQAMSGLQANKNDSGSDSAEISFASGLLIAPHNAPIKQLSATVIELAEHTKTFTRTVNAVTPMLLESIDASTSDINEFFKRRYQPLKQHTDLEKNHYLGDLIMPIHIPGSDELEATAELSKLIAEAQLNSPLRKKIIELLDTPISLETENDLAKQYQALQSWLKQEMPNDYIDEVNTYFKILNDDELNAANTEIPNLDARINSRDLDQIQAIVMFYEYKRYIHLAVPVADQTQENAAQQGGE